MNEYEQFNHDESLRRGIDPAVSASVAWHEGGLDVPARRGTFPTGSSWWAYQLHYGGAGYEHLGTVAGMGNAFTKLTGWRPGDPAAWKDAMRYALDAIAQGGWGPWYGARAIGIIEKMGIAWTGYLTQPDEWDWKQPARVGPRVRIVGLDGSTLLVRSAPNVNAEVLGALREGTILPATSEHAWRQVVYEGTLAWVAGTYTEDA